MVNFTSVVVLALSLTAMATPTVKRTVAQIRISIGQCRDDLITLSGELSQFSSAPNLLPILAIHDTGLKLQESLESATEAVRETNSVTVTDASEILGEIQSGLEPLISAVLLKLIENKPKIDGLPVGNVGAGIKVDLVNLHKTAVTFGDAVLTACPLPLKSSANDIKDSIEEMFQKCLAVYADE